jgi:hypothetical protein
MAFSGEVDFRFTRRVAHVAPDRRKRVKSSNPEPPAPPWTFGNQMWNLPQGTAFAAVPGMTRSGRIALLAKDLAAHYRRSGLALPRWEDYPTKT